MSDVVDLDPLEELLEVVEPDAQDRTAISVPGGRFDRRNSCIWAGPNETVTTTFVSSSSTATPM